MEAAEQGSSSVESAEAEAVLSALGDRRRGESADAGGGRGGGRWGALAELWQVPLLMVAMGAFGYAGYRFVDPKPAPAPGELIAEARKYLDADRPEAAIAYLNAVLEKGSLSGASVGEAHRMLAEGVEKAQRARRLNVAANHREIVEQTAAALGAGAVLAAEDYRRVGESYEALGRPGEALASYRRAMGMDAGLAVSLRRKEIELLLGQNDVTGAEGALGAYLGSAGLTGAERGWALTEKALLLIARRRFGEARALLDEALAMDKSGAFQGEVRFRQGVCAYEMGEFDEAERLLRGARELLTVRNPLDAEASYLLGRLYQRRKDYATAAAFYEVVIMSHPDSDVLQASRMGRGVARVARGEDDAGIEDLSAVCRRMERLAEVGGRLKGGPDAVLAVEMLKEAEDSLVGRARYGAALDVLVLEQGVLARRSAAGGGAAPAEFWARVSQVYEKRAIQVEVEARADGLAAAERDKTLAMARQLRVNAGDAAVSQSHALTLADDGGYAAALWRAVDLYDKAGNVQGVIQALGVFTDERPQDPLTPDALLRLGRAYQAAGLFDKAIEAFQRNQFRHPKSLAASKSLVPLAQAFIAKGPSGYVRAEAVLQGVVDNNPLFTPQADEFRNALFELAQLYYRTQRYEEAIARLDELAKRYPNEERSGQVMFLMGDSYRKSAMLLERPTTRPTTAPTTQGAGAEAQAAGEAEIARRDRLGKAKALFDKVVEHHRRAALAGTASTGAAGDLDRLQQKLAYFYRADCEYDLGEYESAIKLYDQAAFRYQDDPSALAAQVQIVNSWTRMGRSAEARAANERARWLLKRMPPEAFTDGTFSMPKEYWEQWLKWTGDSGMWSQ